MRYAKMLVVLVLLALISAVFPATTVAQQATYHAPTRSVTQAQLRMFGAPDLEAAIRAALPVETTMGRYAIAIDNPASQVPIAALRRMPLDNVVRVSFYEAKDTPDNRAVLLIQTRASSRIVPLVSIRQ